MLEEIEAITRWEPFDIKEGSQHRLVEEVGECWHTMHHSKQAFRLIVLRRQSTPILPHIWESMSDEERRAVAEERYQVIATHADPETMSAAQVVRFYRQRGDHSENRIKEIKNGFNLSYLPGSDFMANALYWQIGALAYNLFLLFRQSFDPSWQRHTIATIRYKLYHIAGKVITHARVLTLKIPTAFLETFERLRRKSLEISLE